MSLVADLERRLGRQLEGPWLTHVLNLYPPYLGAGVRVRERGPRCYLVSMTLRPWNQNYLGTHFGGSLYSMCDPFFALILARNLGSGWEAWDKSATIRFRKPGRGRVSALFEIPEGRIREIREQVEAHGRADALFSAEIRDEGGEVVAEVEKVIHIRRNRSRRG